MLYVKGKIHKKHEIGEEENFSSYINSGRGERGKMWTIKWMRKVIFGLVENKIFSSLPVESIFMLTLTEVISIYPVAIVFMFFLFVPRGENNYNKDARSANS